MTDQPNGKGKLTDITDAQRRSLAKRHLSGHMLVDMEGYAGLDLAQLRKLFKQDKTQSILREEQEHLDIAAVRVRNRMSYGIEDSVDRMKARGAGQDGPNLAFQADKFLIENILPKKEHHVVEQNQTFSLDAQVAVQINDAIDVLKTISATTGGNGKDLSTFTLLGTEGIATAESSETAQDVVVEVPSDPHTDPTLKDSPGGKPDTPAPD